MRSAIDGFSLLEVLVAVALLSVTVTGVASMVTVSSKVAARARSQSSVCLLAMQKLDELRALAWSADSAHGGAPISDTTTSLTASVPAGGGQGLSASPADSLTHTALCCVDYLDAAGAWVSTGLTIPARAVFVRRWNVAASETDPAHTLLLQVLVTPAAADRLRHGGVTRVPGDALLVTIRTRISP